MLIKTDVISSNFINKNIIIIIDSDCLVCNKFSFFVLNKAKYIENIYFFDFKSELYLDLKSKKYLNSTSESIVLLYKSKLFLRSDAILKITKNLIFPYNILYVFKYVPKLIRDFLYDKFAKNRYLISKKLSCDLSMKQKFSKNFISIKNPIDYL